MYFVERFIDINKMMTFSGFDMNCPAVPHMPSLELNVPR